MGASNPFDIGGGRGRKTYKKPSPIAIGFYCYM